MGSSASRPQDEILAVKEIEVSPKEIEVSPKEIEVSPEDFSNRIKDGVFYSMSKLWCTGRHTDLEVIIENTKIHCHSFILCACSNYFTDVLYPRREGVNRTTVTFTSFSKETFETILEALYTGKDVVTLSNVIDLWLACHELDISFLVDVCVQFILKHLTVENIGTVYKTALITRSEKVLQATFEMMQKNFNVFKECDAFLDITFDTLLKLIDSHDLVVTKEDTVVEAVLKWVSCPPDRYLTESNSVHRREHLGKLFTAARLELVSPDCIVMLMACEMVGKHLEAKEAVDRAIVYQLHTGQRHGQWPSSALHRKNSHSANIIVAGYADGRMSVLPVLDLRRWHHCKAFTGFCSSYITLTAFDNTLYAFASPWSSCVLRSSRFPFNRRKGVAFSTLQNKANTHVGVSGQLFIWKESEWQKVTEVSGTEHILVSHGCYMYFLHPVTKKVQKLDLPFTGVATKTLESVPANGLIGCAIAFERSILVFCQELDNSTETTVHCLDTARSTWSRLSDLKGLADIVSFKDGMSTYLLQGSGTVHKIISIHSGQENFRFMGKLWDFQWRICGCVSVGNTLYVCGDESDAASGGRSPDNCTEDRSEVVFVNHGESSCLAAVFDSVQYISGRFDYFQPVILRKDISFQ